MTRVALLAVLSLFTVGASLPLLTAAIDVNRCRGTAIVLDPTTFECAACPKNARAVSGVCVCDAGFAETTDMTTHATVCQDCASLGMAVTNGDRYQNGQQQQRCIPCGGDQQLSCLTDATFNATSKSCSCPQGFALTESGGSLLLAAQMCAPCPNGECSVSACPFPYVPSPDTAGDLPCACADGYTMIYDGICVSTAAYDAMATVVQGSTTASVPLANLDNTGRSGATKLVRMAQADAVGAAVLCQQGNSTACNYLANLCVVMQYNENAVPCALYAELKRLDGCHDAYCERPSQLPWLYYVRGSIDVLTDPNYEIKANAQEQLQFVASTYSLRGRWKGFWLLMGQVNLCRLPNPEFAKFMQAGDTRMTRCFPSWSWMVTADPTDFYELFLINPENSSELIPVPTTVDYSNHKFAPEDVFDAWMTRPAGSFNSGTPAANGLKRRFYAYDNVGGRSDAAAATEIPTYLASLWSASIVLGNVDKSNREVRVPLLVLQYATKDTDGLHVELPENYTSIQSLSELPLARKSSDDAFTAQFMSFFLSDSTLAASGMMITLIVMSCHCFASAWVSTYGWMRRRQNFILDVPAIFRFLVYLCDHISNVYTLIVAIASWYVLISYKSQQWLSIALRFDERYINAMLYTAVVTKGVVVLYRLAEQCNADYFVVDWERSKGQLLRENKIVPVSMWRSTFLANELNELQTLRYWHPLLTMTIIFLFLVGLRYENLALSVPHGTRDADPTAISMKTLRIAVDTFFWIAVALVMYLLEFQVFYRFVVVHPLHSFVDLCSVSNISVIIMPEHQFGYYIHGESIHAHADVSMEEFQNNLFLESQGNLPVRGLGGQNKCQTFEVYVGPYTRQYLNICYTEMAFEEMKSQGKPGKTVNPMKWHFFDCFSRLSRKARVFSQSTLAIKDRINHAFQESVRRAEGTLLVKFVLQKWLGFPPNVMYMNGPQNGEAGGCDLFFFDDVLSYGKAFMCGMDFDLFILYATLFASIDSSLHNIYASMVLTYAVEILFSWYRSSEGVANMSKKTRIDNRFFL